MKKKEVFACNRLVRTFVSIVARVKMQAKISQPTF